MKAHKIRFKTQDSFKGWKQMWCTCIWVIAVLMAIFITPYFWIAAVLVWLEGTDLEVKVDYK